MNTQIESLDLGVVNYGGPRHVVDRDGVFTSFFCGRRGIRFKRRDRMQKPTCSLCISECRRLHIDGV